MSNAANVEAAMAIAASAPAETPAPSSAPAETAPEAPATAESPAEAPAAAPEPKRVDADTLEKLRQRQRAKQQSKPQHDDAEFEEFRAWKAAQQRNSTAPRGIDPDALKRNPAKVLEEHGIDVGAHLNVLTKHVVTPDAATLEAKLEAELGKVRAESSELKSAIEQIREDRQRRDSSKSSARAREEFQAHTADKTKYPSLARLSPDKRANRGAKKARELLDEGIEDFTMEEVAQLVEADLHGELSELLGRDPNEPASSDAESTSPNGADGRAKRPTTITSSAAGSSAAAPRKLTEQERFNAALAVASRS